MIRALHFFGFILLLTLLSFFFVFIRFFIWNKEFQQDFGRDSSSLRKAQITDVNSRKGEKTTFSLPMDYVSELKIDLIGEGLIIQQVEGLSQITAEVFYPEAVTGETYTKLDYQLLSAGDRASFSTDKKLWQSWKTEVKGQHKLLVGYVVVKVPKNLKVLRVSTISGESEISGAFEELNFVSFSGDLYFKGQASKVMLETFKASMHLKGQGTEDFDFNDIHFRTLSGNLIGDGLVQDLSISALSSSVSWQGAWESFSGQFLYLRMKLALTKILRGDWKLYAVSGDMDVQLPEGAKRESSYGLMQRRDLIDESLQFIVKSFAVGLNYLI